MAFSNYERTETCLPFQEMRMVQMMDDDELFTYAKEHSGTWVGSFE